MILWVFVLTGFANAASKSGPSTCVVGSWEQWSECHGTSTPLEFGVPKTAHVDDVYKSLENGRHNMIRMMQLKKEIHKQTAACQADGTCPELNKRKSTGPAPCVDGFADAYPCRNVDLVYFLSLEDLGYGDDMPVHDGETILGNASKHGNDIWGWHDVANNDYYVIVGTSGGSSFVKITDPYNPQVLGFMASQTVASVWRDMKVVNDFVFIGSEAANHGVQIFDLRKLRGLTADNTRRFTPDVHYNLIGNSHNIASNPPNNRIVAVGATDSSYPQTCGGGLHIFDVSNPLDPTFLGCYGGDGYTHDTQCVIYPDTAPDARYHGREICYCYNEDTFTIVDTTDAPNFVLVSRTAYQGSQYTHQGWATEDFTIVLLDDELDEYYSDNKFTRTYVWDVTDLENPTLQNVYQSSETAIDHNQYIVGQYVYQSHYEAGLRVLQIDQANYQLTEVAYFDCLPSSTTANFAGTWSNYPWLPNDVVAVSSIDYGLFLVKVNTTAVELDLAAGNQYAEQTRFREALHGGPDAQCPSLVQTNKCTL